MKKLRHPLSWKDKPVHSEVIKADKRFRVVAAARRSGKSAMLRGMAIKQTNTDTNPKHLPVWLVAPTYTQGKEVLFDPLIDELPRAIVHKVNRADHYIARTNGAKIYLKSTERPDLMLGRGLFWVGLDEYQSMPAHVYEHVIRPSVADTGGSVVFCGTPRGYGNPLHDAYERGQACTGKGQHAACAPPVTSMSQARRLQAQGTPPTCMWHDWQSWHLTAYDAGVLAKEEIDAARQAAMAAGPTALRIWRREWLADFEAFVGRVFESWAPESMVVGSLPKDFDRIVCGVDWGFSESHAGVMLVCGRRDDVWYVLEEVVAHGETIENYWCKRAQALQAKHGFGTLWAPDDRPDGIKSLRRASDGAWATREAKRDPWGGIVALAALMERDGLRVHRSCDTLIKQLASYRWEQTKDGHSKEQPHKAFDDAVDALRHALHTELTGVQEIWGG